MYPSSSIVRMTLSRRMRWPGHIEYMGEIRSAYKIPVEIP
jgi:hypothetical protein